MPESPRPSLFAPARTPRHAAPARLVLVLALAVSVLGLGACGDDDESATTTTAALDDGAGDETSLAGDDAGVVTATRDDDGGEVSVPPAGVLVVSLETCVGCGYSWAMVEEADASVLELASTEIVDADAGDAGEEPVVGGSTDTVFTFNALAEGSTTFVIGYFPPGDPDTAEETFTLTAKVTAAA